MSNDRFTFSETDLPAAIRGLRQSLGRSQEVMAQILGCSLPAYQKWERGDLTPDGEWLIRLLQLCPNEETRNAFRIRAERRSASRERTGPGAAKSEALAFEERARWREIAHTAVDEIYECGKAGNTAADLRLRDFARHLESAARYYSSLVRDN